MKYFLIIFLFCSVLFAQQPLPEKPLAWVNDYSDVLSTRQESDLNNALQKLQEETSTQIFIAIFDKIPEDSYLEDFSTKLYEKWGPGRANEDNGVLIVLFTGDRKIRIEVGYGLEGALTDLQAGRVIDDYMKPEFKKGDYYTGLAQGLAVIIGAVKGEYKIPTKSPRKSKKRSNYIPFIFLLFVILSIINRFRGGGGSTIGRGGSRYRRAGVGIPWLFWGAGGGFGSSGGGSFGGGGGFSGGFGGLSGGGGASGSW